MNEAKRHYKTARIAIASGGFEIGQFVAVRYMGTRDDIKVDGIITKQDIYAVSATKDFDGSEPMIFGRCLSEYCL